MHTAPSQPSDPVRELGPWRGRRARKRGRGGPSAQTGLSFCDDVRPSPMRPPTQHGDRSLDPDHYLVWGLAGVGLGRGLGGAGSKGHECREQSLKSSRRRKPAPGTRWRAPGRKADVGHQRRQLLVCPRLSGRESVSIPEKRVIGQGLPLPSRHGSRFRVLLLGTRRLDQDVSA